MKNIVILQSEYLFKSCDISVSPSILRYFIEIVRFANSGLAKVKQFRHDGVPISFDAFSYLQSDCFSRNCNIITNKQNIKEYPAHNIHEYIYLLE